MLMLGLYTAVIVALLAIEAIWVRKLSERVRRLEKELQSWKLAAEHWEKEAHRW